MRRWNGWGDDAVTYHLPEAAVRYLASILGEGRRPTDASLESLVAKVPQTRLPDHANLTTDPVERLHHAHGQSLPDWVGMRLGCLNAFPDGVFYPQREEDVRAAFEYARQSGARLIPYGGGTSVAGHVTPRLQDGPVVTVDLSRMSRLTGLDEISCLATFEAGASGPAVEQQLVERGYTLGHFPQSWEQSTVGGWVATRSSGQQSYHYGRIEDLFAGGHVETPTGAIDMPALPASAAGPDLRQVILGSEGRFGIITRAIMRVRRVAEAERFYGILFADWESGMEAVREIVQEEVGVSMLRLSDAQETQATLNLSGKNRWLGLANHALGLLGYGGRRTLLILGITGDRAAGTFAHEQAAAIWRRHDALATGQTAGKMWRKKRFVMPYLRNSLWERGYAVDTLETAIPWARVATAANEIKKSITQALEALGERVLVMSHLSHAYRDGASIYVTYLWRHSEDAEETLARWRAMKDAASRAIIANAGTISHQHGVGTDHAPYLKAEKGEAGMRILEAIRSSIDPDRVMNPGKLID